MTDVSIPEVLATSADRACCLLRGSADASRGDELHDPFRCGNAYQDTPCQGGRKVKLNIHQPTDRERFDAEVRNLAPGRHLARFPEFFVKRGGAWTGYRVDKGQLKAASVQSVAAELAALDSAELEREREAAMKVGAKAGGLDAAVASTSRPKSSTPKSEAFVVPGPAGGGQSGGAPGCADGECQGLDTGVIESAPGPLSQGLIIRMRRPKQ